MDKHTLSADDRHFFELVARAAFANPFGEERRELDLRIGEGSPKLGRTEAIDASIARLKQRMEALPSLDLRHYSPPDRRRLEAAILFDVFHEFSPQMDAFVQEQLQRGDEPVEVSFAEELLARLTDHGVALPLAERRLSILYQMRRAFYFIHHSLVGQAASVRKLRQRLWANIFTHDILMYEEKLWDRMEDFSTFFVGETGTGKGMAAAALGHSGWLSFDAEAGRFERSFTESFLPINLSQFPGSLIESELFGHRRGAFTGAVDDHTGVFGRCHRHGVIFLDEIGEVDPTVQVKLLRVLQERVFSPVGSYATHRFHGRVVAATNRNIDELRRQGQFRDDFYYRLCSDIVEIPPLRRRLREDPLELRRLLDHIVADMVGEAPEIVEQVEAVIDDQLPAEYRWPGNVRELKQCVRRVILAREYGGDRRLSSPPEDDDPMRRLYRAMDDEQIEAREVMARYCRILYDRHQNYEEVGRRTGLDRRTVKKYVR